jgi:hypothetical protein
MSYFNTGIRIPKNDSLDLQSTTSNIISLQASNILSSDYSITLPSQIGSLGQVLTISDVTGNTAELEFKNNNGGGSGLEYYYENNVLNTNFKINNNWSNVVISEVSISNNATPWINSLDNLVNTQNLTPIMTVFSSNANVIAIYNVKRVIYLGKSNGWRVDANDNINDVIYNTPGLPDVGTVFSFSYNVSNVAVNSLTGPTGDTGPTGTSGINGVSSGLVLFLDGPTTGTIPANDTLLLIPNSNASTIITHAARNINNVLIATFTTPQNSLTSTTIVEGLWSSYLYASASTINGIFYYFVVDEVDNAGTTVLQNIINGIGNQTSIGTSVNICISQIYGTIKTLASLSSRLRLSIYANYTSGSTKTLTIYMRDGYASNVISTLVANLGATGPTGDTGPTGTVNSTNIIKYITSGGDNLTSQTGTNVSLFTISSPNLTIGKKYILSSDFTFVTTGGFSTIGINIKENTTDVKTYNTQVQQTDSHIARSFSYTSSNIAATITSIEVYLTSTAPTNILTDTLDYYSYQLYEIQ